MGLYPDWGLPKLAEPLVTLAFFVKDPVGSD